MSSTASIPRDYSAWEALRNPAESPLPDPLAGLNIADEHLERVLRGHDLLVQDGAIGTQLQARGAADGGQIPDLASIEHPDIVTDVHRSYVEAGAEMVTTNSFGANSLKLKGAASVQEVCEAAVACAKASGARYVAGSIGPLGSILAPFGPVSFEDAYRAFLEQATALARAGADVLTIETMTDLREAKAALLAAKEAANLPVFASMTYGSNGRTLFGTPPETVAAVLSSLGANVVSVNCSLGPAELVPVVEGLARASRCPVAARPNAGMPRLVGGETVYDVSPDEFAEAMVRILEAGASVVGGCCGTSPEFVERLSRVAASFGHPAERRYEPALRVCDAQKTGEVAPGSLGGLSVVRAGDPDDPDFADDVREGDAESVADEAMDARDEGADVVELCCALEGVSQDLERELLGEAVGLLEEASPVALLVRTDDPLALEAAVRAYAGKPIAATASGAAAALEALLPVAKKYGCPVVIPSASVGDMESELELSRLEGIPGEDFIVEERDGRCAIPASRCVQHLVPVEGGLRIVSAAEKGI